MDSKEATNQKQTNVVDELETYRSYVLELSEKLNRLYDVLEPTLKPEEEGDSEDSVGKINHASERANLLVKINEDLRKESMRIEELIERFDG